MAFRASMALVVMIRRTASGKAKKSSVKNSQSIEDEGISAAFK